MPHQPPAVQSQWALNETATGAIAFSRGLLQAATSDNVSPLAIMTCESFGTLIPACPETRLKIEQLARRSHTSHVIKFISAQIGYTKGDSVELLSRSDGGIRFLCLAATFCTMTRHEAAMRIDSLLEATQSRGQLRPTIAQLQSLMGILESKLAVSDFTTNTAGWAIWFSGQLLPFRDDIYRFHASQSLVPERKELQELILLLSETNRLGEEESVVVQAKPPYVPCLIAFIKWLLGSPPFVQLSSGRVLNHQEKPLVILIVLENPPPKRSHEQAVAANVQGLEISTAYYHKKLKNLVIGVDEATFAKPVQGLVDARVWICHLLSSLYNTYPELHVENELVEAVGEGIFFIISTLVDRVVITDPDYNSPFTYSVGSDDPTHSRSMEVNTSSANSAAMQSCFRCVVFPNAQKRLALARELLGGSFALVWLDSVSERKLQPENIRNMMESPPNPTESGDEITMSRAHEFLRLVVELGADLAFLSLFGTDIDSLPMIRTRT